MFLLKAGIVHETLLIGLYSIVSVENGPHVIPAFCLMGKLLGKIWKGKVGSKLGKEEFEVFCFVFFFRTIFTGIISKSVTVEGGIPSGSWFEEFFHVTGPLIK